MAVSKMRKCLIVTDRQSLSDVLLSLQEFQKFEVVALDDKPSSQAKVMSQIDEQIAKTKRAQQILMPFQPKGQAFQREQLTFDELLSKQTEIESRDILNQTLTLQKEWDDLKKEEQRIRHHIDELNQWRHLHALPRHFHVVSLLLGTIPQTADEKGLRELKELDNCYVDVLFQNEQVKGLAIYCDADNRQTIRDVLDKHQFTPYDYEYDKLPTQEIEQFNQQLEKGLMQQETVKASLKQLAQNSHDLMYLEELLENDKQRQLAEQFIVSHQVVSGLSGWVEEDELQRLTHLLQVTLPENSYVILSDNQQEDGQEPPVQLKNHEWVEPFELLTEMYSLPKYTEVDPTPYLAPFYAVFFGMMVADIGYGLLMLLFTGYMLYKNNLTKGARKNIKLFHILSYPIIAWGILFGSFFSYDIGFGLFSTNQDGVQILYLSVAFGIFQLICGLLINTREQLKQRHVANAISDGLSWVGMLVGLVVMVLGPVLNMPNLESIGLVMIGVSLVSVVLFTAAGATRKITGFGSGLYKLYGATSYIGDLASYTRLMALCVAGASIGSAFNQIIGMLPLLARFSVGILLFIILHGLNIGLALLGAYVHGIRLQFVEFFGKFYEGGGRKFKPLKSYEKYVDIKEREMEEK
ncbi:V-type ATP synthase subunit I [Carnobacteriaceae bacterium zg-ZUI240]|nr:V-type ATP synthase subunit I [Carnobacteriaceae bacterium zg-ZUI240]